MRRFAIAVLALTAVCCSAFAQDRFERSERKIVVDGRSRDYIVYVPKGVALDRRLPMVLGLHGGFGKGENFEQTARLHEARGAEGFVFVYPSGYHRSWNAGNCCG